MCPRVSLPLCFRFFPDSSKILEAQQSGMHGVVPLKQSFGMILSPSLTGFDFVS